MTRTYLKALGSAAACALLAACAQSNSCNPQLLAGRFVGGLEGERTVIDLRANGTGAIASATGGSGPVTWEYEPVSAQVGITAASRLLEPLRKASATPPPPDDSPATVQGEHFLGLRCDADGQAEALVADEDDLVSFARDAGG